MRAWQWIGDRLPLTLNEVAEPTAAPGELVLKIHAAGICKSDAGLLDGVISYLLPGGPITLGHEIAGVVTEVGEGVTGWAVGDRVAISGQVAGPGTSRDGGFAPKVSVQEEFCVRVPDGVPWDQAAVSTDGGMTSFHALTVRGQVGSGTKVGIIGYGGLGSLAVQIALGLGAKVYVAEVKESLFPLIEDAGATAVSRSIADFADEKLDVIVDIAGFGTTTSEAISTVRKGGKVVQVGLGVREATIPITDVTMREIELLGSQGGSPADNARVLDMMAAGKLRSKTNLISFDEIPEGVDRLRRGEVYGRLVAMYGS